MIANPLLPLPDLDATEQLAQRFAPLLQRGDVIALQGELGAGKTTFARALLRALGFTDDVPSPTFTLVQNYEIARFSVAHYDLYRLKSPDELDELGFDDMIHDGVTLIEWPEHAGSRLPTHHLTLHFTLPPDDSRTCRIKGDGSWRERLKDFL